MKIVTHIICLICLAMASCSEKVRTSYATYSEAEREGLFDRGWLPEIIPRSSKGINVKNDLDLNISGGDFVYDRSDLSNFLTHLTRVSDMDDSDYEAYRFEDWVFYIHKTKLHCKYHFHLK